MQVLAIDFKVRAVDELDGGATFALVTRGMQMVLCVRRDILTPEQVEELGRVMAASAVVAAENREKLTPPDGDNALLGALTS